MNAAAQEPYNPIETSTDIIYDILNDILNEVINQIPMDVLNNQENATVNERTIHNIDNDVSNIHSNTNKENEKEDDDESNVNYPNDLIQNILTRDIVSKLQRNRRSGNINQLLYESFGDDIQDNGNKQVGYKLTATRLSV